MKSSNWVTCHPRGTQRLSKTINLQTLSFHIFSFLKLICLATCLPPEPRLHSLFLTPLYNHPFHFTKGGRHKDTLPSHPFNKGLAAWCGSNSDAKRYVYEEPQRVTFAGTKFFVGLIEVRIFYETILVRLDPVMSTLVRDCKVANSQGLEGKALWRQRQRCICKPVDRWDGLLRGSRRKQPCWHLDFRLVASSAMRE